MTLTDARISQPTPLDDQVRSVFAAAGAERYKHQWDVELHVSSLAGGVPVDANVTEGWLRTKLADTDDLIRDAVAETMAETGQTVEEATATVAERRALTGFKRDKRGLYIEGRQIKSMIKENANIAWPKERWGKAAKGSKGFIAEHVFCLDVRVPLLRPLEAGMDEGESVLAPDDVVVNQSFISTFRGTGISLTEVVPVCRLRFRLATDYDFSKKPDERARNFWQHLWVGAEMNGLGAKRSQGYGRFVVTRFDPVAPMG